MINPFWEAGGVYPQKQSLIKQWIAMRGLPDRVSALESRVAALEVKKKPFERGVFAPRVDLSNSRYDPE